MNELVKKSTEDIKDKLYSCIESTFDKIESVKHDLSCIYEGVANDLDILKANEEQIPYSEAYNKGLEDVWELVRELYYKGNITNKDMREIYDIKTINHTEFGTVIMEFTPQEALAKFEAYEKAQEEIKVGDVVKSKAKDYFLLIVLEIQNDVFTGFDGKETYRCMLLDRFKKTNKHIDISSILEQIGGGE